MSDDLREEARKRLREWAERNPISPADKESAAAMARRISGTDEIERLRAALKTAREALEVFASWHQTHPDATLPRGLEHADFALARAALAKEPRVDPDHPSWNELIEEEP
jgi:predicted mannosyl-3-phosphoglycerate phosphatase (HAD superfamily)